MEISGIEPLTSCVQGRRSPSWAISPIHNFNILFSFFTHYIVTFDSSCSNNWVVGLSGLEPPTSPLSGVRSNHLSYRPNRILSSIILFFSLSTTIKQTVWTLKVDSIFGKEVIQPQVPLRLPCYDFTPVMNHTVVNAPPKRLSYLLLVQPTPMVWRAVCTRPRERIHRDILIRDY